MKKIISILVLLFSIGSYACSCNEGISTQNLFKSSDLVFTGKIINIKPYQPKVYSNGDEIIEEYSNVIVEIETKDLFKGEFKKVIKIVTGVGGGDCGYKFMEGQEYVIFANDYGIYTEKEDGILETNRCKGNGKTADRKVMLDIIHNMK